MSLSKFLISYVIVVPFGALLLFASGPMIHSWSSDAQGLWGVLLGGSTVIVANVLWMRWER